MIKAIIFDMDGVLIEAKEWHYEALNKALGLFGYSISLHEHLTSYDGLPTKTKLEMLSVEKGLPRDLHRFINEMKQIYTMNIVHAKCKPQFNHEYALSRLKANGYKLAVASNSIRHTIEVMMDKSCLTPYLNCIFSNEDVTHPKPNPEIYTLTMQQLEISPEQCLVIEDNENGVKAALASGAHLLQVKDVHDVTYSNIMQRIKQIEGVF